MKKIDNWKIDCDNNIKIKLMLSILFLIEMVKKLVIIVIVVTFDY